MLLTSFSQRSAENARRARDMLLGCQNSRKARLGGLAGLQDPAVMANKRAEEDALRRAAASRPELAADCDAALKTIDKSLDAMGHDPQRLRPAGGRPGVQLAGCSRIARTLVRMADETAKPNADRLREYRESEPGFAQAGAVFRRRPIYDDLETLLLADSLSMYMEQNGCGGGNGIRLVREGDGRQVAAAAGGRTGARHQAGRRGGPPPIGRRRPAGHRGLGRSDDPVGPAGRRAGPAGPHGLRATGRASRRREAYGKLANVRFALFGRTAIPTPRSRCGLSFGTVKRCEENGVPAPAWTTIGGLFATPRSTATPTRSTCRKSWIEHKDRLEPGHADEFRLARPTSSAATRAARW